jgi:U32 family peptidase
MQRTIELLAPGGDVDSIKAAIAAGADAVYCGLNNFNARNRAINIELKDLNGILNLAHCNNCKIYLTINIIIVESEIRALVNLLNKLVNTSIDGIIVQDLGLFYLLATQFKSLEIHASTQMTTHNVGQIAFLNKLSATQVNLSRELNLSEISELTTVAHKNQIKTEIFVHGSNCLSFSGLCYMSSVLEGKSGNRGRCSQPCRDEYLQTPAGNRFPLNLKDNSAYFDLPEIHSAGVDSIKIEGRIKKFHYVYTVVEAWRTQLDRLYQNRKLNSDYGALQRVFNRDLSNGFLKGELNKNMYIDNPRDNSARYFLTSSDPLLADDGEHIKKQLQVLRTEIIVAAQDKIDTLSIEKQPLTISIAGSVGSPLTVTVDRIEDSFSVRSVMTLVDAGAYSLSLNNQKHDGSKSNSDDQSPVKKISIKPLNHAIFAKRFNAINDTEYWIQKIELSGLQEDLFIPSRELTSIKDRIVFALNSSRQRVEPISLPRFKSTIHTNVTPSLAVLISSPKQLSECRNLPAEIIFQLPSCFKDNGRELADIFTTNVEITPWFPSVIIGDDYNIAVDLLKQIKPNRIVTDNSGIAYEAYKQGIQWIAGPCLNIVNSLSLIGLKENFSCHGAFISNEISKQQIADICSPDNFDLYYTIYQPQLLLTSRQCLFHQINGCEKDSVGDHCRLNCHQSASITNLKNENLLLVKEKGGYHKIYSPDYFFNPRIVTDLPGIFSSFIIDLREIDVQNEVDRNLSKIITLFSNLIAGDKTSLIELQQLLPPTSDTQYKNGI